MENSQLKLANISQDWNWLSLLDTFNPKKRKQKVGFEVLWKVYIVHVIVILLLLSFVVAVVILVLIPIAILIVSLCLVPWVDKRT